MDSKPQLSRLLLCACLAAQVPPLAAADPVAAAAQPTVPEQDLPAWMRDSQRLAHLLGGQSVGEVSDAKVIQRITTPIEGLDALVIEAMVSAKDGEPHPETFVFYVDRSGRYLIAGLFIDMDENRNLGQVIERQVRGERAESPAKALTPLQMHGIDAESIDLLDGALIMVVDLGPELGRRNLARVAGLRQALLDEGHKPRPLRIVPVSAAHDEMSTAAMAMALGYDTLNPGDGYPKLLEYADKGHDASWLDKEGLRNDPALKQAMGMGIFKLDDNSTQALLARLNTLPLVYEIKGDQAVPVPVPTEGEDWKTLLLKR